MKREAPVSLIKEDGEMMDAKDKVEEGIPTKARTTHAKTETTKALHDLLSGKYESVHDSTEHGEPRITKGNELSQPPSLTTQTNPLTLLTIEEVAEVQKELQEVEHHRQQITILRRISKEARHSGKPIEVTPLAQHMLGEPREKARPSSQPAREEKTQEGTSMPKSLQMILAHLHNIQYQTMHDKDQLLTSRKQATAVAEINDELREKI